MIHCHAQLAQVTEMRSACLPYACCFAFAAAKQPRKLRDVKINPAMAATFASMTPASNNSSSGNLGKHRN